MGSSVSSMGWRFESDLDELNTLFSAENLPYKIMTYICNCKDAEPVGITCHKFDEAEDVEYVCPHCLNTDFYDANYMLSESAWHSDIHELFPIEQLMALPPSILHDPYSSGKRFQMKIDIPYAYDCVRNKLYYLEKVLYETIINPSQPPMEKIYAEFNLYEEHDPLDRLIYDIKTPSLDVAISECELLSNYKQVILDSLKSNHRYSTHPSIPSCRNLNQAAVFLAYPHLKEFEFVYWSHLHILPSNQEWTVMEALDFVANYRSEKTLKKAIYKEYNKMMLTSDKYNFRFTKAVAQHIHDVNVAIRMMSIRFNQHLQMIENELLNRFMAFLVKHYTAKQLEKLFKAYAENDLFWFVDTIRAFDQTEEYLEEFPNVRCSIYDLHDALMEVLHSESMREQLTHVTFNYPQIYHKACGIMDGYEVRLPYSGFELYEWGNTLHNCLSTYYERITNHNSVIFGFFENGVLSMAIELVNGEIIQAAKKYNKKLTQQDSDRVKKWHQRLMMSGKGGDKL